jgi:hypothetical protein
VNFSLSNVLAVHDNVVRNTIGIHQTKGGMCADACHLGVSRTVGTIRRGQQPVRLGYDFLFKRKVDVVCS